MAVNVDELHAAMEQSGYPVSGIAHVAPVSTAATFVRVGNAIVRIDWINEPADLDLQNALGAIAGIVDPEEAPSIILTTQGSPDGQ
jgi:hypothetical protein